MKWFKRKAVTLSAPLVEFVEDPAQELTGIEKHDQDEAARRASEWGKEREAMKKRLAELEAEIAPQMQQIAMLRLQLTPSWGWCGNIASLAGQANIVPDGSLAAMGSLAGNLFGGVGLGLFNENTRNY